MPWKDLSLRAWLRRIVLAIGILFAAFVVACGMLVFLIWRSFSPHTVIVAESPDARAAVRITEACTFVDCRVRVYLVQPGGEREIVDKQDCYLRFAHIAWNADSRRFGVYCKMGICGDVKLGWDIETSQPVPFGEFLPVIRQDIIKSYSLSPAVLSRYDGDPLRWATWYLDGKPPPGFAAFDERHQHSLWDLLLP